MSKEDCLIKGCDNLAHTRGLCPKHYQKYVYRVKKGKTSWEELERLGLILPPKSEIINDKPESWWAGAGQVANTLNSASKAHNITHIGEHILLIHPNVLGGKTTKKEVLLQIKEVLKANDLDDLVILIFNSKK